ncbi:hypothetical protein T08_14566 [Trichinella sp. T8]|nr:hypothetical protein T08_14566 [Trichinella sp. T8]
MNNKALLGGTPDKSLQGEPNLIFENNNYLTSVGRNRQKSLIVVEGTPDRSLQTDQPHIFVGAL